MPLGLGLGALIALLVITLISTFMIRDSLRRHADYFLGMFLGGDLVFLLAVDIPGAFGSMGKPKAPGLGDMIILMFSWTYVPSLQMPPWLSPEQVTFIFYGILVLVIVAAIVFLLHGRPQFSFGSKKGGKGGGGGGDGLRGR